MRYASIARVLMLLTVSGCGYGSTHERSREDVEMERQSVEESAIQTDGRMTDIVAGRGAGVFVEYSSGGEWAITVACDTERSGLACEWDVYVSPLSVEDLALIDEDRDDDDFAGEDEEGGVDLLTTTSTELDQMRFVGGAGEAIRLTVLLDARFLDRDPEPERFVYWVGEQGVLHAGAPSNPIELVPTEP